MDDEYLEDLLTFLAKYSWIYDYQLTRFFVDRVWESIPSEWEPCLLNLSIDELNRLPFGLCMKDDWPENLKLFVKDALKFSSRRQETPWLIKEIEIDSNTKRGMSPKKQHEVSNMAALVHHLAMKIGCELIVDVGSGLGYLGQILNKKLGYPVIGLESKQSHTSGADKRKDNKDARSGIHNVTFDLQPDIQCIKEFYKLMYALRSKESLDLNDSAATNTGVEYVESDLIFACLNRQNVSINEDEKKNNPGDKTVISDEPICSCEIREYDGKNLNQKNEISKENINTMHSLTSSEREITCDNQKHTENICRTGCVDLHSVTSLCGTHDETSDVTHITSYVTHDDTSDVTHDDTSDVTVSKHFSSLSTNSSTLSEDISEKTRYTIGPHDDIDSPQVLMIGLHCCGDLTPTMMKYFAELEFVRGLCCVSCCYHRMEYKDVEKHFTNFPLSQSMKNAIEKVKMKYENWNLNTYSMRLAAQETRARWRNQTKEDHDLHVRNVAYRGVLELFINEGSMKHEKLFRKVVHKSDLTSFQSYIDTACSRIFSPACTDLDIASSKQRLSQIYQEYQTKFKYIEPVTALQVMLQPVLEGMIHTDRLSWLQEHGFHSNIIPVFDEFISPRNVALVATRNPNK